jgi:multidrug efflux pump subunit AcrB
VDKDQTEPAQTEPTQVLEGRFAITTRRPVAILMVVMAVCVFGWISYQRLALDLMPNITYPTLTVRTEYPGTAPEEVETLISRPLEQELGVVPNLISISSVSKAGQSDVILEFAWDTDMNAISQEIREKVDRRRLPDGADRPLLLRYDPSLDPIMRMGLYGPQDLFELRYLAEFEIKRQLEAVEGVAAVKIKGGLEEEIHVALNERKLAVLGLDISQIRTRLAQGNVNMPGGNLREGQTEYLIRTLNEFQNVDEIGALIVARQGGADIRLRDIGRVFKDHKDREIITRVNGNESVEIEIYKEADANIVAVARRVNNQLFGLPEQRAYVENLQREQENRGRESTIEAEGDSSKADMGDQRQQEARRTREHLVMTDFISNRLPDATSLEILSDQSIFIGNSISEVQNSALIGGAMAVLVLFIFLRNVLHTLIVGLTIPVSIVATFAPMFMSDVSLNIMSLGGLALGVGMLVDNSIVVLESIFRCREEGDGIAAATVRGTSEVGGAVFASTLTTIAVFFPIVFVEGVAGQVFGDMALTVVFSLLASLGVALYFIPMLASRQVRSVTLNQWERSDFLRLESLARMRQTADESQPGARRLVSGLSALPFMLYELALRLLLVVGVLVGMVLKAVASILFEVVWPVAKAVELFWIKPSTSFQQSVCAWAGGGGLWRWEFAQRVWPEILCLKAPADLAAGLEGCWDWLRRGRGWRLAPKGLICLLAVPYFFVRFLLQTVMRLVGVVLHLVLLLLALTVLCLMVLLGLVLMPLFLPVLFVFERGFGLVQRLYPVLLHAALRKKGVVVFGAVATFAFCWYYMLPTLGTTLIPQVHQGEFNLDVTLAVGTPLEKTSEVLGRVEKVVLRQPEVERASTSAGTDGSASSSAEEGEHTGRVAVKLKADSDAATEERLVQRLRAQLADLAEVQLKVSHPALFSFKTPIEVEVRGFELLEMRRVAQEVAQTLRQVEGLVDVKSSLQAGNPELQIVYNRDRLAEFGLDLRQVAEQVRTKVQGTVATDFRQEDQNIDILVRLREIDRLGLDELRRLVINPGNRLEGGRVAPPIPLAAVAEIRVNEGPSEIRRIDQQRAALISANLRETDLGTASKRIEAALAEMDFPPGFSYMISGQNREMETSLQSLVFALGLAIFLVYIVMASQFESLIHPFIIMFTVPLALIGVIIALYIGQVPISIVVFIGLIMLAGIVVNNAIVLVDYINTLRREGVVKVEAIVRAGSVRLRPIFMTTATTVLGLLPMALGLGEGAEIRTPMALTVIAGLISSTFLTLIVIPTVYAIVDRGD